MQRPDFVTEVDVSGVESGSGTWVDVSSYLRRLEANRGAPDALTPIEAAEATYVFDNRDGTFDSENAASILAGFAPGARIRTYADGFGYVAASGITLDADDITDALRAARLSGDARARRHLEFWEGFENATPSTGWSSFQGDGTHGLTRITSPVRLGAAAGRFEVRNGDVFSGGERSEVLRTSPNYGVGTVVGQERWFGGSVRFVGPFTHVAPGGFELYHQVHGDDARFLQAPLRLQIDPTATHFEARLFSGNYPNLAAAQAGTGASTDLRWPMLELEDDVFFDYRYGVLWTVDATGWLVFDMKHQTDSVWTRFVEREGIQTLGSITGDATAMTTYDKVGLYRSSGVGTQVLIHDAVRIGHSPEDLDYTEPAVGSADSSVGIWLPTTNLHPNGGAETNTSGIGVNGAGVTVTRVARAGFFGANVIKLDMPGTSSSESYQRVQSLTGSLVHTWQALVEVAPGERCRIWVVDPASATLATFSFTGDGIPRLVSVTFTSTTTGNYNLRIGRTATGAAQTVYIDGAQIAQRAYATPYVETDGGSATRNEGGAQAPAALMDETQMWVALKVRLGFGRSSGPGCYGFLWGDSTSALLGLQFDSADKKWKAKRLAAGSGASAGADTTEFQPGDYGLIIAAYTATAVKVSVNGRAFVSAGNTNIPTLTATLAELGSAGTIIASQQLDGAVMWAAWGRGTLADADAAELYRRFGRSAAGEPRPTDLQFPSSSDVRALWAAVDGTYWTKGPGYVFGGYIDGLPETWPAQGHDAVVELEAKDGLNVLAETPMPTSSPDFADFSDVMSAYRPTLYYPLNEPEGTKVVHHKRVKHHKRKRHVRRWNTRETRAEAEGISGPAGSYKNTPLLGEPGLIIGSLDTSVRFRAAQSEHVRIVLEASDSDLVNANVGTMGIWLKLPSIPGGTGTTYSVIALPIGSGVSEGNPVMRLAVQKFSATEMAVIGVAQFAGGAQGSANAGAAGPYIHANEGVFVVMRFDGTNTATFLGGGGAGATVTQCGTADTDVGAALANPANGDPLFLARQPGATPEYFDGWLAHFFYCERALSLAQLQAIFDSGSLRGWNQELASARIANVLDKLGLWASPYAELETAARQIQPVRQGGQTGLEPIRDAEEVDSGRFFFMPANVPKFLAKGWRDRAPHNVSVMTFGDAAAFLADPVDVVPYADVALVTSRDQLIREARVTRVGSDSTQIVTSALYSAGKMKPTTALDVLTVNDADALAIAGELVSQYERPQKRVEGLSIVGRPETWPAFFLDVGDRVQIVRNPPGAPQRSLDAHVDGIRIVLDRSLEETVELAVSPR